MKKTIALLLALVLILSAAISASAEEDSVTKPISKIIFGTADFTEKGQVKTLVIRAENFEPTTVMQIVVTFDEERFELQNVETGSETGGVKNRVTNSAGSMIPDATISNPVPGEIDIVWDDIKAISGNGVLANLQFKFIGDIPAGETKVTASVDLVTSDENAPIFRGEASEGGNGDPPIIDIPEVEEGPAGFRVSGSVTSYLDANGKVSIELFEGENASASYSTEITGNTGTYSIEGVEPGTYTMKVSKAGHATFEETVVVSDADITKDVTLYRYGDVDGDEQITSYDASLILQYVVGNIGENDLVIIVADVDDDKQITSYDASLILQYVVGNINKFPVE